MIRMIATEFHRLRVDQLGQLRQSYGVVVQRIIVERIVVIEVVS